ncbi:MAG: hypothetical protein AAFQ82_03330, partial [Myxococcota bacterium]
PGVVDIELSATNDVPGLLTVRDNVVETDPSVNYASGFRVFVNGGVSASATGNEVGGYSRVESSGTGALAVDDNIIIGRRASMRVGIYSNGDEGGLVDAKTSTISGNEVRSTDSSGGMTVRVRSDNERDSVATVSNNIVSNQQAYSSGLRVYANKGSSDSDVIANVIGNQVDGRLRLRADGTAAASDGELEINVRDNLVGSDRSSAIDLDANPRENDLTVTITGNSVTSNSAGIDVFVDQDNDPATTNVEVSKNLALGGGSGSAISVRNRDGGVGTVFNATVRNNIALRSGSGIAAYGNGIRIRTDSFANGTGQIDVVHNTIQGEFVSGSVYVNGSNAPNAVINVIDNVIANEVASAIETTLVTNPPTYNQDNNLIRSGEGGMSDVEADAQFVNPIERFALLVVSDPFNSEVEIIDGALSEGDRVVLAGDMMVYTVSAVVGPTAVLEGAPLPAGSDTAVAFVWSEANFVSAVPDYALEAGSPGSGAATDTGDIGALGGSDPYTPPTLP